MNTEYKSSRNKPGAFFTLPPTMRELIKVKIRTPFSKHVTFSRLGCSEIAFFVPLTLSHDQCVFFTSTQHFCHIMIQGTVHIAKRFKTNWKKNTRTVFCSSRAHKCHVFSLWRIKTVQYDKCYQPPIELHHVVSTKPSLGHH